MQVHAAQAAYYGGLDCIYLLYPKVLLRSPIGLQPLKDIATHRIVGGNWLFVVFVLLMLIV